MDEGKPQLRATAPLEETLVELTPPARWVKRALVAMMVMLLLLVLVRLWWGWEADRRLAAAIDAARQRGEPVLLADFARPEVPDEQNAVVLLLEAAELYRPMSQERERFLFQPGNGLQVPLLPRTVEILAEDRQDNEDVLRLIREARSRPRSGWNVDWSAVVRGEYQRWNSDASMQVELSRFVARSASLAHHRGDTEEVVELLLDGLFLARALDDRGTLLDHLLALGTEAVTTFSISLLAPHLELLPSDQASVARMIAGLLEEEGRRDRAVRAWLVDRAVAIERLKHLPVPNYQFDAQANFIRIDPTWGDHVLTVVVRPLHVMIALWWFERNTSIAQGVAAPEPKAALIMTVGTSSLAEISPLAMAFAGPEMRSMHFGGSHDMHLRAIMARRINAVKLAMRLYELDNGRLPDSLAALVPAYLPELPADPFAADGRPLGYVHTAERAFVYSLFQSATDDVAGGWTPKPADHENWRRGMFISFYRTGSEAEAEVDEGQEPGDQMQPDDEQ